ncbi:MAG: LamG domain-containing protein [Planctomycetes bacterium]|nr:LamG domain-containing protein [Planctomycetota bacterium]
MKTRSLSALVVVGVCAVISTPNIAYSITLFSDNFDSTPLATVTTSTTSSGYKVVGRLSEPTNPILEDHRVIFGYDYGSPVATPVAIPPAPNSIGGTTKGLYITTNKNDATSSTRTSVNVYPVDGSLQPRVFGGNFSLKFDLWQNWGAGAGPTATAELALYGINHSGNAANIYFSSVPTESDGLFYSMSANGRVPATDAGARDFGVHQGAGATYAALKTTGFISQLGPNFDNLDPGYSALFPFRPAFPNIEAGGSGERWNQVEVKQENGVISQYLNGTLISQYTNTTAYTAGDIMLGYWDYVSSVGQPDHYAIFDNIRVEGDAFFAPNFAVEIDRDTGGVTLTNGGLAAGSIIGYSLLSDAGSLNSSSWLSIADNYDANSGGSVDNNDTWIEFEALSADLSEGTLGSASIAANQDVNLGTAWRRSPLEDVVVEVLLSDGTVVTENAIFSGDPIKLGDYDLDGDVDEADFDVYNAGLSSDLSGLSAYAAYQSGDLDGDGDNDKFDFLLFKNAYLDDLSGAGNGASLPESAVPEPHSILLLAIAGLACIAARRARFLSSITKTRSFSALVVVGVCATFSTPDIAFSQILFSDNFDSTPLAVVTTSTISSGYKVVGRVPENTPVQTEDHTVIFGFDYGAVTDAAVIPSAPNSTGGTKKGLFITTNKNDGTASTRTSVNVYPVVGSVSRSFSGNYSLKFDLWQNWGSGSSISATTELSLYGINHSGNAENIYFSVPPTTSDGLFYSMAANGNVGATETGARDFGVHQGTGASYAALKTTGFISQLEPNFDNSDPGFAALFPARPAFPNLAAGSPAEQWVQGEVRQEGGIISQYLNGTLISRYQNSTAYTSGDIMFGYWDYLNGVGDASNFAIFDNIVVSALPEPSTLKLKVNTTSGAVSIDHVVNAAPVGFDIDLYEIESPGNGTTGSLRPANWNSLDEQGFDSSAAPGDYNANDVVGADDYVVWRKTNLNGEAGYNTWRSNFGSTGESAWAEYGNVDSTIVGETSLGSSLLANGISLSLGNLFDTTKPHDLVFTYHVAGETGFRTGVVQYFSSGSGGSAVPEPGSVLSALVCLGSIALLRGYRSRAAGRVAVVLVALSMMSPIASASNFIDRDYKLGEASGENGVAGQPVGVASGFGVTFDDAGSPGTGTFQDLTPVGDVVYENVSSRPLAGGGLQLGIRFDGNGDYLRGLRFGWPSTSASTFGSPPVDLAGIFDRGLQFWVNPNDAQLGNGSIQSVVRDTNQHGVLISGTGTWLMDYRDTLFDTGVPVHTNAVNGGWHHVMLVRPSGVSNGSRMYVDGVAVAFDGSGEYLLADDAQLVVGSNTGGDSFAFTGGTGEFFNGVVDDLTVFAFGTTTSGTVHGTFDFRADNEFAANALAGVVTGDLTGDGDVMGDGLPGSGEPNADDDVLAFVQNWGMRNEINGGLVGDIETFALGDFTFDGRIDWHDWFILRGAHSSPASISAEAFSQTGVPEPGAILLALLGGCFSLLVIPPRTRPALYNK